MQSISEGSMVMVPQADPVQQNGATAWCEVSAVASTVSISVCGRDVTAFIGEDPSIASLQSILQKELSLNGQTFDIFDERGTNLATDGDLRAAVARGAALGANLSEASVHYIENRREELSQLQWKLMRDQVAGIAEKLLQVGHRVQELTEAMTTMKHQQEESCRRMRHEMESAVDSAREAGKHDLLHLAERVDACSADVASERNRREVAKQNSEQQIQGLRDMLAADRSTRRTELTNTNSMLEEGRQALLEESRTRETIEARRIGDVTWLSERIEALAKSQAEKVQDLCEQVKTVALNVNSSLQDSTRSVLQVQSIAESTQIEASSRLKILEDRTYSIDSKIGEIANREVLHYDELQFQQRKMYNGLQELQLEDRAKGPAMRRGHAEEADTSPLSTSFPTALLTEIEYGGLPAPRSSGSLGAIPTRSCPAPHDRDGSSSLRGLSLGARGASARSVSPPLPVQPSSLTAPQGATTPTSPHVRTVTNPSALPATTSSLGTSGSFSGSQTNLCRSSSQRLLPSASTPQAYALPPRSVSPPVARYQSTTVGTGVWTAMPQQGRLSMPRSRAATAM